MNGPQQSCLGHQSVADWLNSIHFTWTSKQVPPCKHVHNTCIMPSTFLTLHLPTKLYHSFGFDYLIPMSVYPYWFGIPKYSESICKKITNDPRLRECKIHLSTSEFPIVLGRKASLAIVNCATARGKKRVVVCVYPHPSSPLPTAPECNGMCILVIKSTQLMRLSQLSQTQTTRINTSLHPVHCCCLHARIHTATATFFRHVDALLCAVCTIVLLPYVFPGSDLGLLWRVYVGPERWSR